MNHSDEEYSLIAIILEMPYIVRNDDNVHEEQTQKKEGEEEETSRLIRQLGKTNLTAYDSGGNM